MARDPIGEAFDAVKNGTPDAERKLMVADVEADVTGVGAEIVDALFERHNARTELGRKSR